MSDSFGVQVLHSLCDASNNFSNVVESEQSADIFLEVFLKVSFLTKFKDKVVVIGCFKCFA